MRHSKLESHELFESEIYQLTAGYLNRIKFKYNWKDRSLPPYVEARRDLSVGFGNYYNFKLRFVFESDLERWYALFAKQPKLYKRANYWLKLNDNWSDRVIIRNIQRLTNHFDDNISKMEFDTGTGVPEIIFPHYLNDDKPLDNK